MSSYYDGTPFLKSDLYAKKLLSLYEKAIEKATMYGYRYFSDYDDTGFFSFMGQLESTREFRELMSTLHKQVMTQIDSSAKQMWVLGDGMLDKRVNELAKRAGIDPKLIPRQPANLKGLKSFLERRHRLGDLSDRVWLTNELFKKDMEMAINLNLGQGKSAHELAREVKRLLREPDRMYRRVRNKFGNLVWSKEALEYKPGTGVYRSSYRNAFRLARTENNMAFHSAAHERYNKSDFVVGFEVILSGRGDHCPMCSSLAGKYPKEFKFIGWHPQCRCSTIAILNTEDEFFENIKRERNNELPNTSAEQITEPPDEFKQWVYDTRNKFRGRATKAPYVYRENRKFVNKIKKPSSKTPSKPKPEEKYLLTADKYNQYIKDGITFKVYKNFPDEGIKDIDKILEMYNNKYEGLNLDDILNAYNKAFKELGAVGTPDMLVDLNRHSLSIKMTADNITVNRKFRFMYETKSVEHAYLSINEKYQGNGATKRLFADMVDVYDKWGIDVINVHANIDRGGYAWGRYGFFAEWDSETKDLVQNLLDGYNPKSQEYKTIENLMLKAKSDNYFDMNALTSIAGIKDKMLHADWYGYLNLKDPVQGKIFRDYLNR